MTFDFTVIVLLAGGIILALLAIYGRESRPSVGRALAGIMIAGAVLRIYHAATPSLWLDEFGTFWAVHTTSFADSLRRVWASVPQTPAYYAIVWAVTHVFGYSEASLRAPSIVAGLGALPLFYLFVKNA